MNNKSKVQNPLTIIAIFAGIAEIAGTTVLLGLPLEIQRTFVWFVLLFPFVLVVLFFLVLYFKHDVLYAPSDFSDESHFIDILENKRNKINTDLNEVTSGLEEAKKKLTESSTGDQNPQQLQELSGKLDLIQSKVESAKEANNIIKMREDLIRLNNTEILIKSYRDEILKVIKGAGEKGLRREEIAEILKLPAYSVLLDLSSLEKSNEIRTIEGRYFLNPKIKSA